MKRTVRFLAAAAALGLSAGAFAASPATAKPDQKPINWVRAVYDSIHGRIISSWKDNKDVFTLEVSIPANTTASVILPSDKVENILESDKPLKKLSETEGIKSVRSEEGQTTVKIDSGSYIFTVRKKQDKE